jgi:DNA-binding response OmpR family regulator
VELQLTAHFNPLKVLLVEDDMEQAGRIVALLSEADCKVEHVPDGGDAVRAAMSLRPHLILVDLGLPTIDGWDAIRRIRRLSLSLRPHIVAISGFTDLRSRELAFEAGCDEYVVKPFDVAAVLRTFRARTAELQATRRGIVTASTDRGGGAARRR